VLQWGLMTVIFALDNIIDSTSNIVSSALDLTRRSLIGAWGSGEHGGDFLETVTKSFDNMLDPFASMRTNYLQTSYIKRNFNYVGIKEVVLGKKISRKFWKNKRSLDENFVYIPLIESLGQLLSNKRIAKLIRKSRQCDSDIYYDICDGQIFLTDKFLADHPDLNFEFINICHKNYNISDRRRNRIKSQLISSPYMQLKYLKLFNVYYNIYKKQ
jgi:hypothetical protein